jgi:hypothetical protein
MKLYGNRNYPTLWFAYSRETGWVMFPAEVGGWARREAARGLDPIHLREVPVKLAVNTGIPGALYVLGEAA